MNAKIKYGLYIITGLMLIGFFCRVVYLDVIWASTMPKLPDPASQRIVERVLHHGVHIYITPKENSRFQWLQWLLMICAVCMMVIKAIDLNISKKS